MASTNQSQASGKNNLPPELMDIVGPALQFGGLSALSGTIVGGFSGILVSRTPVLFAVASSIQWGILALPSGEPALLFFLVIKPRPYINTARESPFYQSRCVSCRCYWGYTAWAKKRSAWVCRVWGSWICGTEIYEAVDERKLEEMRLEEGGKENSEESWANSKWVPWKKLTDDEYEEC
ncbi:hypothetical protein DID88_007127 [Monilinia fructigena]|uniref:Uncharacterized protein n=1 Tax=Monilinia fructigena TaxID=38457 RepID=A0A395J825_9HELO|nr:hypothetical protein DID88_007127 [Monilinia fructigena]